MKIRDIQHLLDAKLLCHGDNLDTEVTSAFGCDLMSDVLAYVKDQCVLLTGLVNPQVIRTAIMLDMVPYPHTFSHSSGPPPEFPEPLLRRNGPYPGGYQK